MGVVVAALVPVWAAIGTIAAIAADYTIQVEVTEVPRWAVIDHVLGIVIWLILLFGTWLISYSRSRAQT